MEQVTQFNYIIMGQLLYLVYLLLQASSDDNDEEDHKPVRKKFPRCSMRVLCDWYQESISGQGNFP